MHMYHMLRFRLSRDDPFHHILFMPSIGGGHFLYSFGTSGNILCFFISEFLGGLDYLMLAAVKSDQYSGTWFSNFSGNGRAYDSHWCVINCQLGRDYPV